VRGGEDLQLPRRLENIGVLASTDTKNGDRVLAYLHQGS
jgi:hypothetical protein